MTAVEISPARTAHPGWVYIVQGEVTQLVKIGMAFDDPGRRLRSLQNSSPDRLIVLAVYSPHHSTCSAEESLLHIRFTGHRAHGEWFRPDPALVDWAWDDAPTPSAVKKRCQNDLDAVWKRRL